MNNLFRKAVLCLSTWILGVIWLFAAMGKTADPNLSIVDKIFGHDAGGIVIALLIAGEYTLGFCFISGLCQRATSIAGVFTIAAFTLYAVAVPSPEGCHCFGSIAQHGSFFGNPRLRNVCLLGFSVLNLCLLESDARKKIRGVMAGERPQNTSSVAE